jgi:hypothetical protein
MALNFPFDGESELALISQIKEAKYPPLEGRPYSDNLKNLIYQMLVKV